MKMTPQAPTATETREPPERQLPHNTEAELAVLDSIAIDPAALPQVVDLLVPRDFYATGHAAIYAAMRALHEREEVVDTVTLMDELERTGEWQDVSSVVYRLGLHVPNSGSVLHYARIVRRCARNRALIAAAGKIAKLAYHDADDDATCDLAMREILAVMQRGSTSGQTRTKSFAEVVDEMAADVLARLDADEPIGLPTGFAGRAPWLRKERVGPQDRAHGRPSRSLTGRRHGGRGDARNVRQAAGAPAGRRLRGN